MVESAVGLGGRTAVLRADEVSGKKKKKKKKVSNSNAAGHPFCALPRGILRGNGHMWAPPLYHFVWDFSLFYEYTLILKGGATSLELVYYISVVYFANLCTS